MENTTNQEDCSLKSEKKRLTIPVIRVSSQELDDEVGRDMGYYEYLECRFSNGSFMSYKYPNQYLVLDCSDGQAYCVIFEE